MGLERLFIENKEVWCGISEPGGLRFHNNLISCFRTTTGVIHDTFFLCDRVIFRSRLLLAKLFIRKNKAWCGLSEPRRKFPHRFGVLGGNPKGPSPFIERHGVGATPSYGEEFVKRAIRRTLRTWESVNRSKTRGRNDARSLVIRVSFLLTKLTVSFLPF